MTGKSFNIVIIGLILVTITAIISCSTPSNDNDLVLRGDYLGQAPADTIPELFAPGFISAGLNERDAAFSPDGDEFYYSIWLPTRKGVIMVTKRQDSRWTQPQVAPFSGQYSDVEPFITADGNKLYFASNQPLVGAGEPKDYDIWFVEKDSLGWGKPQNLGKPVNTEGDEFYPSLTKTGTLYFTAPNNGSEDIFRSGFINGNYADPENLGDSINSAAGEFNSLIAPDESFLIFSSFGRSDGLGGGDLYISFRIQDGIWTKAKNMGDKFNNNRLDYCPALSHDSKYFLYTRSIISSECADSVLKSYQDVTELHKCPQNGNSDIYWIDSQVINSLKPQ